jgi:Kdo2-lipid IVA lauroyltransferase/acyltransferase
VNATEAPAAPEGPPLRHWAEAILAWCGFGLVRLLPIDLVSAIGGFFGRVIGPKLGITRRARRNLARAFPEKSRAEIEALVRGMWDNLGRVVFEFPHVRHLRPLTDRRRFEVIGAEHIRALKSDGKAGVLFSAHVANWEMVPLLVSEIGLPTLIFYRPPNNRLVDGLIRFARRLPNVTPAPKGSEGARAAIATLKQGGHVGALIDQKMNDGILVPFFGRDAMTASAVAEFARRYACPIVGINVERIAGARFRLIVEPPITIEPTDDRTGDVRAAMTRLNRIVEGWIRARPEQWLWLHNRWPD